MNEQIKCFLINFFTLQPDFFAVKSELNLQKKKSCAGSEVLETGPPQWTELCRSLISAARLPHRDQSSSSSIARSDIFHFFCFIVVSFVYLFSFSCDEIFRWCRRWKVPHEGQWGTSHPQEHVPWVCSVGGELGGFSKHQLREKCFIFWALTSGTSVCGAPCLYLGLESPAAAACHTRLRSFTPLTPASSVNMAARKCSARRRHVHTLIRTHTPDTQSVPWHRSQDDRHTTRQGLVWFGFEKIL